MVLFRILMTSLFFVQLVFTAKASTDVLPPKFNEKIQFEQFESKDGVLKNKSGNVLVIRQEKMDPKIAVKLTKNKLVQLKLLFAPQKAAYPGMLTKDQSCSTVADFPKEIIDNKELMTWVSEMPATDDYFYGSCGSREEPYWSQYQVLFCKKTGVIYDIKYFKPKEKSKIKDSIGFQIANCP